VTAFPERRLAPGVVLHRIHRAANGPAFFGTSGAMRFDPSPTHLERFGTCYLAFEQISAFLEVFADLPVVSQAEVDRRVLSTLGVNGELRLADLTDRIVLGKFHVDGSVHVEMVRAATRRLASDRFDEGLDGVVYRIRHDPRLELEAVALFGEPGEHPERFRPVSTQPIPLSVINRARAEFGIDVQPPPTLP
jgi:hypothetical protein